jgi:hypothetical protein
MPKYRRPLNPDQLQVLELLLKFRFATTNQIALFLNKPNQAFVFKRLKILEEQKYILRHYDNSYRLAGKPAAYSLLPDGLRQLKASGIDTTDSQLKNIYRNKLLLERSIQQHITVLSIYLGHRKDDIEVKYFTKQDLSNNAFWYFPSPLPDAYIKTDDSHSFLYVFDDRQPFFAITKTLKTLAKYEEGGIWDGTGTKFPTIILAIENANMHARLYDFIDENMEGMSIQIMDDWIKPGSQSSRLPGVY